MKGLISFELKNALRKGINLGNTKDGIYWIDYRFERIPKCCYTCGVFGHKEEDCETLKTAKQRNEEFIPRDLGPWLKAGEIGRKVEWGGTNGPREGQKGLYEERKIGTMKKVSTDELMEKLACMSMTGNKETQQTQSLEIMGVGKDKDGTQGDMALRKEVEVVINANKEDGVEKVGKGQDKTGGTKNDVSTPILEVGPNNAMLDINMSAHYMEDKGRTGGVRKFKRMAREKENCVPLDLAITRILSDLTNTVKEAGKGGSNPSFTWRSIMKGKEVLRKGLVRRIGDGSTTYIFKSPWIKLGENFTIPYSNQNLDINATVDELILPEILRSRGIDIDNKCCVCDSEEETIWHALYGCSVLQDFWRNRGLRFEDIGGNGSSFIDWFQGQIQSLNSREVETYCIMASKIWQRRNSVIHGNAPYSLSRIWEDTQRMIELMREGDEAIPTNPNRTDSSTNGWQAPSSWFVFKLNVDANLRLNERGRIGCVIRDNNGRCIAAMTMKIQGVVDVAQLEALAVYEGMCLAKSLMCTDILVESDAKQVMDLLKGVHSEGVCAHIGTALNPKLRGNPSLMKVVRIGDAILTGIPLESSLRSWTTESGQVSFPVRSSPSPPPMPLKTGSM
ncbi:uncharacterized protein G2W53_034396 [Senna tora]|uniref:CCHC-type domain-containing protein n=1 Tax=Senna tora TaxID=362788 RepID=A0A834T2G7_9FABA|nr:uncharacterized protein G2W53_034396 [Senna tora]